MVILLFFFFVSAACHLRSFDTKLMSLVDERNGNYLIRSGSLLSTDSNEIAWSDVTHTLIKRGVSLNNHTVYYDICLLNLNEVDDLHSINIEKQFFQGQYKHFIHWPIFGETFSPLTFTDNPTGLNFLSQSFDVWSSDKLSELVTFIEHLLNTPTDHGGNKVIIVHCMHGLDRTGEVIGAYSLHNHNRNCLCDFLNKEISLNGNCHFSPKINNYNALLWYSAKLRHLQ